VLERKASVNRTTKAGCTPLHLCCMTRHPNITKFLAIECKANVSAVDCRNYTPLHYACEAGCTESVSCLLRLMPNEFFAKNTIPLDKIARENKHRDVATIVDFHRKLKPSVGVI
jgi:ankyrin repeat protein